MSGRTQRPLRRPSEIWKKLGQRVKRPFQLESFFTAGPAEPGRFSPESATFAHAKSATIARFEALSTRGDGPAPRSGRV